VYNNVAVTQEQDMQHPKHTATRKVRKQGRKSIKYRNIKQVAKNTNPEVQEAFSANINRQKNGPEIGWSLTRQISGTTLNNEKLVRSKCPLTKADTRKSLRNMLQQHGFQVISLMTSAHLIAAQLARIPTYKHSRNCQIPAPSLPRNSKCNLSWSFTV
jgi:hypothetical protein